MEGETERGQFIRNHFPLTSEAAAIASNILIRNSGIDFSLFRGAF